jgi:hypothetical protein
MERRNNNKAKGRPGKQIAAVILVLAASDPWPVECLPKKSSHQGNRKCQMKIFHFLRGTGRNLSRLPGVRWLYSVGPYSNYLVQVCCHVSIKTHKFSQSLHNISQSLWRSLPPLSALIPLASVLLWVCVEAERFGDHADDNFQGFQCCASSTSHCLHYASGGANDGGRSWAWGQRWRYTPESWARGICRHEGWAHPFPGSCLRAFALTLCRSVFYRWQMLSKWWTMLAVEGLLQWNLHHTPSLASRSWSLCSENLRTLRSVNLKVMVCRVHAWLLLFLIE